MLQNFSLMKHLKSMLTLALFALTLTSHAQQREDEVVGMLINHTDFAIFPADGPGDNPAPPGSTKCYLFDKEGDGKLDSLGPVLPKGLPKPVTVMVFCHPVGKEFQVRLDKSSGKLAIIFEKVGAKADTGRVVKMSN